MVSLSISRIRYSTIETKEALRIEYNGFIFCMSTLVKSEVCCTKAFTRVRMKKRKPVISNKGTFICFNNSVSSLYNYKIFKK